MKNTDILIGSKIKIVESSNKQLEGMKGIVTDETKNTVTIKTSKGIKKLIKSQIKTE